MGPMKVQSQIRQNADEVSNMMSALGKWEKKIAVKDEAIRVLNKILKEVIEDYQFLISELKRKSDALSKNKQYSSKIEAVQCN